MNLGVQAREVADAGVVLVLNRIQYANVMIPLIWIHRMHCIGDSGFEWHVKARQLVLSQLHAAHVMKRVLGGGNLTGNALDANDIGIVNQRMPSLKAEIVNRKDDRVEKRLVLGVERAIQEDSVIVVSRFIDCEGHQSSTIEAKSDFRVSSSSFNLVFGAGRGWTSGCLPTRLLRDSFNFTIFPGFKVVFASRTLPGADMTTVWPRPLVRASVTL